MSNIVDPVNPNEDEISAKEKILVRLIDHACWLISRSLFLGMVVFITIYLDIPLRSILEGNIWQQMARERTKTFLDEKRMLDETRRYLDEIVVCLVTMRKADSVYSEALNKTRVDFTNALNRFEEVFSSRKSVLQSPDLELTYYDIRDTTRRIASELGAIQSLENPRKFSAQADLVDHLASKAKFLSKQYICDRATKQNGFEGACL